MKLPIAWLTELLECGLDEEALAAACKRWDLKPDTDPVVTLGNLFTFAGFSLEEIEGEGDDRVLDLEVLANRPDCQGILGLAREAATLLRTNLKIPPTTLDESDESASDFASVEVLDPELCPRYTGRIIRGVKIGPSPDWLQKRLESMGLIPRNNIVDITNLVLFELNQPLHAFDLNQLAGSKIIVRRAKEGEPFKPLYDEVPPLTSETLVIADAERPVAIGGVIGGAGSEVTEETTDLLLEAAYFQPANIRRTSRRLKVATDSSYRFERGIDLESVAWASARAANLICEIAGGKVARGILDSNPEPRPTKEISVRHERVQLLIGIPVPAEESKAILSTLGCEVVRETSDELTVRVPSFRRGDLEREIDLIEEIARLNGYDKVPVDTGMSARIPPSSPMEVTVDRVRENFSQLGYYECVTDSLIDPSWSNPGVWTDAPRLAIDPRSVMREDHSQLRNNLLLSLLTVCRHNQDQRVESIRLFECGTAYIPGEGGGQPRERAVLGIVDDQGFAHMHDAVQRLAATLSLTSGRLKSQTVQQGKAPSFLAPGAACRLIRVRESEEGEHAEDPIGWLGLLSPSLTQSFGLKEAPAVAELDLASLAAMATGPSRYRPLPTQPEVARDVAIVVDEAVRWEEVERFARRFEEPLRDATEKPRFLSVFRGKQVGAGKKSVAFSVIYRAEDRSLTDDEVNEAHDRFVKELTSQFKATLRG